MNIREFFEGAVLRLPKSRPNGDFREFLRVAFEAFVREIDNLDRSCHVCAAIAAARGDAVDCASFVESAVRSYFEGQPAAAFAEVERGLARVAPRITNLFSAEIDGDALEPLFRMAKLSPQQLSREYMFHWPMELRGSVGRHRYGIHGFPCLYLGGSLRICQMECRIPDAALPDIAISRFGTTRKVQVLDFGYRPSALSRVAQGLASRPAGSNPGLETLLVNYVACWPLIAAASVRVLSPQDQFYPEYIVPQLVTQWLMQSSTCDGVRYFSTKYDSDPDAIRRSANYVFPVREYGLEAGHCGMLKSTFAFTEPTYFAPTAGVISQQLRDNEARLQTLGLAQLT